jgi:arginine repressor
MLIDGNVLYLKTKKGQNEIMAAVSDKANDWAIMGKIE